MDNEKSPHLRIIPGEAPAEESSDGSAELLARVDPKLVEDTENQTAMILGELGIDDAPSREFVRDQMLTLACYAWCRSYRDAALAEEPPSATRHKQPKSSKPKPKKRT